MTDRLIRITTALAVMAVAAVAAIISYQHAYELVRSHGESGTTARLLPFTVDGLIWAASIVVLDASRRSQPIPRLAAWSLGAGIVATVGANVAHGMGHGSVGALVVSSPWIRRCPHSGFSFARRTTRRAMPGTVGGRPGLRRPLVSCLLPASLRCQASSVAGVIGKISVQRLRGRSRASAANHTRSAGSYRIRPAWRRSTAFSCRSTSSSASFAKSLRHTRRAGPSSRRTSR